MKDKKYTFIPESQLQSKASVESPFAVTITKGYMIYINKFDAEMYALDKKYIRIYADIPKRSIAWTVVDGGNLHELKDLRQLSKNPQSGCIVLSVSKILKSMDIPAEQLPIKGIPVTTYKDSMIEAPLSVITIPSHKNHD